MPKRSNLYVGRAGHLAVMSELLFRGWNTAIPEVDVGDDIFVVHDRNGNLIRVQVKTAIAKSRNYGHSAQFNLPLSQLRTGADPDITYIFAIRLHGRWDDFVVINRQNLNNEHELHGIGAVYRDRLVLWLRFEEARVTCSLRDLSRYRNDWDTRFPII